MNQIEYSAPRKKLEKHLASVHQRCICVVLHVGGNASVGSVDVVSVGALVGEVCARELTDSDWR